MNAGGVICKQIADHAVTTLVVWIDARGNGAMRYRHGPWLFQAQKPTDLSGATETGAP